MTALIGRSQGYCGVGLGTNSMLKQRRRVSGSLKGIPQWCADMLIGVFACFFFSFSGVSFFLSQKQAARGGRGTQGVTKWEGGKGEKGKRGKGEKGKRGKGEKGKRGKGEKGKRGKGEKGKRGKGEKGKRGRLGRWIDV